MMGKKTQSNKGTLTCPEGNGGDWTPVLSECHDGLVIPDVVEDDPAISETDGYHVHRGCLAKLKGNRHLVRHSMLLRSRNDSCGNYLETEDMDGVSM